MWIKICGNTTPEDALSAANAGADAVGFVFAPSVRRVDAEEVGRITPRLPQSVEAVGVFPALAAEEIVAMALQAGLGAVQLHGELDLSLIAGLNEAFQGRVRIVPALHWKVDGGAESAAQVTGQLEALAGQGIVRRVLIDSKVGAATGGTGRTFDWAAAGPVFQAAPDGLQLILAGGLRPENVAEAVRRLQPWGVDVSSGVEAEPGRKDIARVAAFIAAARGERG